MTNRLEFSPGIDLVGAEDVVLLQDRAVVGLTAWLIDAARCAAAAGRGLQVVTPMQTRLTRLAWSELFRRPGARWVVREEGSDRWYDGLRGVGLQWDGGRFAPEPDPSPAWLRRTELTACVQVVARVRYQPLDTAVLGAATDLLFRELTGAPPLGWGTEEPATQPWRPQHVTAFCRRRMPAPSWLAVVGGSADPAVRPAIGSVEVHNRPAGLEEITTLWVAQPGPDLPDDDVLTAVVDRLASEFELVSLSMTGRRTAPDTSAPPSFTGPPVPLGIGVGTAAGQDQAGFGAVPVVDGHQVRSVGPRSEPAAWYPVGDRSWRSFAALMSTVIPAAGRSEDRTR